MVRGLPSGGPEHIGDDLALEHVGLGRMAVAAAVGPQGQPGRSDVMVNVEPFHMAGPGLVRRLHHFSLVIERVYLAPFVIIGLDLLEALVALQGFG